MRLPILLTLFFLYSTNAWCLDKARIESRVDEAVAKYGVTGKGVIYGMLDRGIDWQNKDFRNADGSTRIAYIFDLTDDSGAQVANNPYKLGTIYTRDQINAALNGGPALATRDAVGHGTANTGIAAGNGSNNHQYRGIAFNATIIAVKIVAEDIPAHDGQPLEKAFYDPRRIPVAIDFVRDKAKELGMPASIVLDIGSIGGPTDGTSTLVRKFDSSVGTAAGLSLIVGSGDDGGVPNRAGGVVSTGGRVDLKIQKNTTGTLSLDLWYPGTDRYDVIVQSPRSTYGLFQSPAADQADFRQNLGDVSYFHYGENSATSWGPPNGKRELFVFLSGPVGTYTVSLFGAVASGNRFHATLNPSAGSLVGYDEKKNNIFLDHREPGSISDFGSSHNAVLVSTYVNQTAWTDIDGVSRTLIGEGNPGELWTGQSVGPTFDNRSTIDIATPAETIFTTYDPKSYWGTFRGNQIQEGQGLYGAAGANSSANPFAAGVIALMLEANPRLDAFTIKDILHKSARTDAFTGPTPNVSWGYGKIDAVAALQIVTSTPAPSFTLDAIENGATFKSGGVAPGEIFTIFGQGLGASPLSGLVLGAGGLVQPAISGTEVFFDGVPAPLIYTTSGQVAGVVPYSVSGKKTTMVQVQYEGVASNGVSIPVVASSPALFVAAQLGDSHAAALNQDNSVNSSLNPADRGSFVVLYGTGEGQTLPGGVDGKLTAGTFPKPLSAVSINIGGVQIPPGDIAYVGGAPELVAGVLQINVKIPNSVQSGSVPIVLTIGGVSSPAAMISIK